MAAAIGWHSGLIVVWPKRSAVLERGRQYSSCTGHYRLPAGLPSADAYPKRRRPEFFFPLLENG